jgi:hypothetical protein
MARPRLTIAQILAWADAHHERTGRWPSKASGPIEQSPGDTWSAVNDGLVGGARGLPKGLSLSKLLDKHRSVRRLSLRKILAWADEHRRRTGKWPRRLSGRIEGTARETWSAVDQALRVGSRGLRGGSSLARLLTRRRGVHNQKALPDLTDAQVLRWCDAHRRRTGQWPKARDGAIPRSGGETWSRIDDALQCGRRRLPQTTLAALLWEHRNVRNSRQLPRLTVRQILAWADDHHGRTGAWPTLLSGRIAGTAHETWRSVDLALSKGNRGLRGKTSLARLLTRYRGVRNVRDLPDLTVHQVMRWCDAHHRRTGKWPTARDGAVPGSGGETWAGVNYAMRSARRGLPRTTLADFLREHRGVDKRSRRPRLTEQLIRQWARRHKDQTGAWPSRRSGRVIGEPNENWAAINMALRKGHRGLPGGSTLSRTLRGHKAGLIPEVAARGEGVDDVSTSATLDS